MKKPKLYTSRPRAGSSSLPSRQPPPTSPPQPNPKSLSSHPWLSDERAQLSNRMDQVQNLSRQITEVTSQMEKWFHTFSKFSHMVQDRKVFNDFLSKMKSPTQSGGKEKQSGSGSPGTTFSPNSLKSGGGEGEAPSIPKPHSEDGDSLYDLINAPGMKTIVDQIMKNRSNRRKKKS
ncbi:hypothetical protein [Desmospora profundinema]|uniref:Uncharacterized protein n=1 Tax=Desmospora profundinema TaxID=1571184 RepID=A0ABU1IN94_9BACL|nr:hypothetical protein [Desmospora profundinema]MDR6225250.1 hypothetical protein [Desmospora profundinema]